MSAKVQENVVKQCWIKDADMWEQLPSTISPPGDIGQEHLLARDCFSFNNNPDQELSPTQEGKSGDRSFSETDMIDTGDSFHLNMMSPFSGKELLTRLTYSTGYTSDPDVDDIIHSVCTQLLRFGVFECMSSVKDNVSTPEHDRPSNTIPKFQLTEKYKWATKGEDTQHMDVEKMKRLRLHNKHLKSRVNHLSKEIVALQSQAKMEKSFPVRPCQIEVHSEGKTNTSVSMPSTVLSISTFNEGSGSRVSLSFTDPECRSLTNNNQSRRKNSSQSHSTTPLSCDSYKTATESLKQDLEDLYDEPITINCNKSDDPLINQSDVPNQPEEQIKFNRIFSQSSSDQSVSKDSDSSTLTGLDTQLCSRCRQSIAVKNRLSNASIDSGLSQSSLAFPTCSATESEASLSVSPPIRNLLLSQSTPVFGTEFEDDSYVSYTHDSTTVLSNRNLDDIPSTNHKSEDISSTNHKLSHILEDTAVANDMIVNPTATLPAPPPPPPPPLYSNHTMPRRKALVKPRVNLKPLHWRRIQLIIRSIHVGKQPVTRIWEKLQEPKLDSNELDELFSIDENDGKERLATMTSSMLRRKNFTKVLDRKRSQNLGIILSSIRQPFSEVKKALLSFEFDAKFLSIDTWRALYDARATEKELAEIQEQMESNPKCALDKPEQFLYNLNNMSFGAERIKCFLLKSRSEEVIKDVTLQLDSMTDICNYMTSSIQIENLLSLLLAIGNYLNGGNNSRGQADGFSLDILPKLKDIKGKRQINLLRYLATKYKTLYGKVGEKRHTTLPLPSLSKLITASDINFKEMSETVYSLQLELSDCTSLMAKVYSTLNEQSSNQAFYEQMSQFLSHTNNRMADICTGVEKIKKSFSGMVQFFSAPHADWQNVTPSQFLEPWVMFSKDLADVWEPSNPHPFNSRGSAFF